MCIGLKRFKNCFQDNALTKAFTTLGDETLNDFYGLGDETLDHILYSTLGNYTLDFDLDDIGDDILCFMIQLNSRRRYTIFSLRHDSPRH